MAKNPRTGSSFDDFLKEEGIYEECAATALKNILARAWSLSKRAGKNEGE
jgi:antitoxin HicB